MPTTVETPIFSVIVHKSQLKLMGLISSGVQAAYISVFPMGKVHHLVCKYSDHVQTHAVQPNNEECQWRQLVV
jgi:hypothetical protein